MQNTYVIYSANEAATNDGAGFWSNEFGWVECVTDATPFSEEDKQEMGLPMSIGQDAAWCPATDFSGASAA